MGGQTKKPEQKPAFQLLIDSWHREGSKEKGKGRAAPKSLDISEMGNGGSFLKGNGAGAMQKIFWLFETKNQEEVSTFNGKSEVHCSCFPAYFFGGG